MAAPTRAQIRTRARAILAACTTLTMGTDVTAGATIATLPAYEVTLAGGSRIFGRAQGTNDLTLTVRVFVYTATVTDPNDEVEARSKIASAEAQIDPLADWLAAHQRLRLNDGGYGDTSPITDTGAGLLDYNRELYAGFTLEFTIFVRH